MRATETNIPTHVLAELRHAQVSEDRLVLTRQISDRKVYQDTSDVLARIGGKWNTKAKAHLFNTSDDVRGLVAEMLTTQQMPRKNELAYFPTPARIVSMMLSHFPQQCFCDGFHWLEPSAGEGAITQGLIERGVAPEKITAIESDPTRHNKLARQTINAHLDDFLEWSPDHEIRYVAMNPPFSKGGVSTLYLDHITRAWCMVENDGMLVSIAPSSLLFRTDAKTKKLRELAERVGFITPLPDDAFKEAGTSVSTVMVGLFC